MTDAHDRPAAGGKGFATRSAVRGLLRTVVLAMLTSLALALAQPAAARTITVVFDDSGSMRENARWSYASYSLQVLRSLVRPSDRVNVIYMNQPGVAEYTGGRMQSEVDAIRSRTGLPSAKNGTPYASVQRAMQSVAGSREEDAWLLVVTDGEFEDVPADFEAGIRSFVSANPRVRVAFLGIAQRATNRVFGAWQAIAGAELFFAETVDSIIPTMESIGAKLTSMGAGSEGPRIEVAGDRLNFTPRFPIRRMVLMQQSASDAEAIAVRSASAAGKKLELATALRAKAPGSVRANAATAGMQLGSGEIARDAKVVIELVSPAPESSRFVLFPEVAARLEVRLTDDRERPLARNGGTFNLCAGRTLRARARVLFPTASGQEEASSTDIAVKVRLGQREVTLQPRDHEFVGELTLAAGEQSIATTASSQGYFHFQENGVIRVVDCPPRKIGIAYGPEDSPPDGNHPWRAPVTRLDSAAPMVIVPLIDGKPATPDAFVGLRADFDLAGLNANVTTGPAEWRIQPSLKWSSPAFTPVGRFDVRLKLSSSDPSDRIEAPETLEFVVEDPGFLRRWGPLLGKLLGLLAALVYVYGVVTKPRLAKGSTIVRTRDGNKKTYYPPSGMAAMLGRLVPFVPERMERTPIPFIAHTNGKVRVPRKDEKTNWRLNGDEIPPKKIVLLGKNQTLSIGQDTYEYKF